MYSRYRLLHLVLLTHLRERLRTTLQRCKAEKYTLHCFQSKISLVWKNGMEYGKIVFRSAPCPARQRDIFGLRNDLTFSLNINTNYNRVQGCRNPEEMGDISPPIIWLWSTSASPSIMWPWSASESLKVGLQHLNSGKKLFQFWWRPFFWSSLNLLTWKKSLSRFIPPNVEKWAKLG